ncbi:MAG: DALR domain-containing protein, partial [Planctomycetota bacterium]
VSPDKKDPADFALWKKAEPNHIMQWPSPWGVGYPGWHLECSVMSMKYLGATIDIHGGGLENQFPHHECEIAQSEAANGVQFVKYWLHNNMVTVDGQKMGKSLNNFVTLKQAFSGGHERLTRYYEPLAIRQLILNSHYRSPLDFSDAALFAAQSGYERITAAVKAVRKRLAQAPEGEADEKTTDQLTDLTARFQASMNDDLNTSVALSVVFDLVRLANTVLEEGSATTGTLDAIDHLFRDLGGDVLGVVKEEYEDTSEVDETRIDSVVQILIEQRAEARKNKYFEKADELRDRLDEAGIVLEDKPDGTEWRWK